MNILPVPQSIKEKEGSFFLMNSSVALSVDCDARLVKAARNLGSDIEKVTKTHVVITKFLEKPLEVKPIVITVDEKESEGYELVISDTVITIKGDSDRGAFYGIQTLRQLINEFGAKLPCMDIVDKPDFSTRGLYYDVTRGCVPKMETIKNLIDNLAYYKVNHFEIYIEHAFDFAEYRGVISNLGYLTADQVMELDDYCYDNFIEFVPSLATFGHLREVLNSPQYVHLNEMDIEPTYLKQNRKGSHYTIDAVNPESFELIKSVLDQYIPLFRSNKFNICCDETFDVAKGKNKDREPGELYWEFASKIINHVKSRGKEVMMWADIVLKHEELLPQIPKDITMLNWSYEGNPNLAKIVTLKEKGLRQMVCTAATTYGKMVDQVDRTSANIRKMVECGYENGAVGVLNTVWCPGDYCTMNDNMYGIVLGAAKSWNVHTPVDKELDNKININFYGDKSERVVDFMYELSAGVDIAPMDCMKPWYKAVKFDEGDKILKIDYDNAFSDFDGAIKMIARCDEIIEALSEIRMQVPQKADIYDDLIKSAEGVAISCKLFLKASGAEGYQDKAKLYNDVQLWLERFSESWRRENTESELRERIWFFNDLFTII